MRQINVSKLVASAIVALALLGGTESTRGEVIFDNGSPLLAPVPAQGALFADADNASYTSATDDFALSSGDGNRIYAITWWGVYGSGVANPPTDDFQMKLYNYVTPTVSTNRNVAILNLARTATTDTLNGLTVYRYDARVSNPFSIPYLDVQTNVTYWLGISNDSGGNNWAWAQSQNSGGNAYQYSATSGTWGARNKELAFQLLTIPEPASLLLAALAVGGFWAFRRRLCSDGR